MRFPTQERSRKLFLSLQRFWRIDLISGGLKASGRRALPDGGWVGMVRRRSSAFGTACTRVPARRPAPAAGRPR